MQSHNVSTAGVGIALLIALFVAILSAFLMYQAGPHDVVIPGVPANELAGLESASEGEAAVSREDAIEIARANTSEASNLAVRQVVLGRFGDDAYEYQRGLLVWVVSFADVDQLGRVFISGPFQRDRSCDWAWHYGYWVVTLDAETGGEVSTSNGAFFDPSLPPTFDSPDNSDREYCVALVERDRAQARGYP